MRTISITLTLGLLVPLLCFGQKKDVRLLSYSKISLCDSIKTERYPTYLRKKEIKDETTSLSIAVLANCTADYYGLMRIDQDTLNLFYFPKGLFPKSAPRDYYIIQDGYTPVMNDEVETTFCDCYLEMTYNILGIDNPKFLKINGRVVNKKKN